MLPQAALDCVHVVRYDAHCTTLTELISLIREAHRQNGAPFLSIAVAQHGANEFGQWEFTSDLTVDLTHMHGAIDQLAPIIETLAAALSKTRAGKAHIDLLACNLATSCRGLVPALERMYGIDFRASTDETGNDLSGGDWKMETDNDYDVAADYLDADKLTAYTETMAKANDTKLPPKKLTQKEKADRKNNPRNLQHLQNESNQKAAENKKKNQKRQTRCRSIPQRQKCPSTRRPTTRGTNGTRMRTSQQSSPFHSPTPEKKQKGENFHDTVEKFMKCKLNKVQQAGALKAILDARLEAMNQKQNLKNSTQTE